MVNLLLQHVLPNRELLLTFYSHLGGGTAVVCLLLTLGDDKQRRVATFAAHVTVACFVFRSLICCVLKFGCLPHTGDCKLLLQTKGQISQQQDHWDSGECAAATLLSFYVFLFISTRSRYGLDVLDLRHVQSDMTCDARCVVARCEYRRLQRVSAGLTTEGSRSRSSRNPRAGRQVLFWQTLPNARGCCATFPYH